MRGARRESMPGKMLPCLRDSNLGAKDPFASVSLPLRRAPLTRWGERESRWRTPKVKLALSFIPSLRIRTPDHE